MLIIGPEICHVDRCPHGCTSDTGCKGTVAKERESLPEQIAALGYPNAERIAKMLEHSRAHMKALAELVGLDSRSFKGYPGREWIDREQAMQLMPTLRDHATALTAMLREELLRPAGVSASDGEPGRAAMHTTPAPKQE